MKEDLDTKRAKLKSWLALNRMSRADLADKLGMSVTSINGWFSNTNISDRKWTEIKRLFEVQTDAPDSRMVDPEQLKVVATIFTASDLDRLKTAADILGISVEELVRQSALERIR